MLFRFVERVGCLICLFCLKCCDREGLLELCFVWVLILFFCGVSFCCLFCCFVSVIVLINSGVLHLLFNVDGFYYYLDLCVLGVLT